MLSIKECMSSLRRGQCRPQTFRIDIYFIQPGVIDIGLAFEDGVQRWDYGFRVLFSLPHYQFIVSDTDGVPVKFGGLELSG